MSRTSSWGIDDGLPGGGNFDPTWVRAVPGRTAPEQCRDWLTEVLTDFDGVGVPHVVLRVTHVFKSVEELDAFLAEHPEGQFDPAASWTALRAYNSPDQGPGPAVPHPRGA
jgi:hypothetical protein